MTPSPSAATTPSRGPRKEPAPGNRDRPARSAKPGSAAQSAGNRLSRIVRLVVGVTATSPAVTVRTSDACRNWRMRAPRRPCRARGGGFSHDTEGHVVAGFGDFFRARGAQPDCKEVTPLLAREHVRGTADSPGTWLARIGSSQADSAIDANPPSSSKRTSPHARRRRPMQISSPLELRARRARRSAEDP